MYVSSIRYCQNLSYWLSGSLVTFIAMITLIFVGTPEESIPLKFCLILCQYFCRKKTVDSAKNLFICVVLRLPPLFILLLWVDSSRESTCVFLVTFIYLKLYNCVYVVVTIRNLSLRYFILFYRPLVL